MNMWVSWWQSDGHCCSGVSGKDSVPGKSCKLATPRSVFVDLSLEFSTWTSEQKNIIIRWDIHKFNKQWISAKIPKMRHIDTTMRPTFCLAASMRPDCATWRIAQTHRQKRCIGQLWVQLVMLAIWPNKWPVTMKTWQLRTANAYWCQVWPVHDYIDFKNLCWRFKQQDICLSYPSK